MISKAIKPVGFSMLTCTWVVPPIGTVARKGSTETTMVDACAGETWSARDFAVRPGTAASISVVTMSSVKALVYGICSILGIVFTFATVRRPDWAFATRGAR